MIACSGSALGCKEMKFVKESLFDYCTTEDSCGRFVPLDLPTDPWGPIVVKHIPCGFRMQILRKMHVSMLVVL